MPSSRFGHGVGNWSVPLDGRPDLRVHWAAGSDEVAMSRVLFVMHGTNRNASDYRDAWAPLVEGHDVVVLAPEFSNDAYPGAEEYNLGGMRGGDGDERPRSQWAFTSIETVFDAWLRETSSTKDVYDMFGHSAGAQFTHRFALYMTDTRLRRAAAANAGWYTMPDESVEFPYGLDGGPDVDLKKFLARDLLVLLGGQDVENENLRSDDGANAQGDTRIERGFSFYNAGRSAASDAGVSLGWSLDVVPDAGHDYVAMSRAAAGLLLA